MDPLNAAMKNLLYPGEVVKYIPKFEHIYAITSKGRVFSEKKGRVYVTLKGEEYAATVYKELKAFNVRGYKAVCLSYKDIFTTIKKKNYYIHELLVTTFLGGYNKYFFRIRHINNKKDDNRLENLKLEFRRKDKDFIEDYKRQQRMLELLNDYSTDAK
ncbi:MAG: hypothetical protein ACI3VR_11845 [Intestinibacter sp.]|uniref:hypothetical protein n=1 Tax=Intestinibacter sp. TaxID=1965304 RepID=UPI003F1470E4